MTGIIEMHYVEVMFVGLPVRRPSSVAANVSSPKQRFRRRLVLKSALNLYSELILAISVQSKIYFSWDLNLSRA